MPPGSRRTFQNQRVQILPDEAREFIALSEAVSEKLRDLKESRQWNSESSVSNDIRAMPSRPR